MFAQFSALLYELTANEDYRLIISDGENISGSAEWKVQKVEMATLITLHVIDAEKINLQTILEYDEGIRVVEESVSQRFGQIANVYLFVGGDVPTFEGVEEYFGQQIFSIFWHLNLETGEITVPKGQPKKLFNLREMISKARKNMSSETEEKTFAEITSRAENLRPVAKHRYPIISIALILINALILGLMYLEGYTDENISVPVRFGAIVSHFVIQNGEWYRLFTAMFLHFGVAHFFSNAVGILIFGTRLERYLGRRIFCAVYIFSGLLGSVFSLVHLHFAQPFVVSAGASGAVYGIVGAIFIYTRISKRSIELLNSYVMLIYIGLGFVVGFSIPNIDNFAHLGGLVGGMLIGGIYAVATKKNDA